MTILLLLFPVIGFLLFKKVLYKDVESDYNKWLKEIPIDHTKEAWDRAKSLVPSFLLLGIPVHLAIGAILLKAVVTVILMMTVYLFFFDGMYNAKRGFDWWFLGSVDPDDAWTDKLQRKIPLPILKVLKIGIPLLFLISYVVLTIQALF